VVRNFGLFASEKCSVFNSGRNFGLFVLRSVVFSFSGRNFGLFGLGKCSVSNLNAILACLC
jgi:hypothetical protein